MDKGFIKLNRKFFSHKMWEAARTFSECEAWIDLLQSARFEATEKIERVGGREIKYGRGQYPASNRYLALKWNWGEQRVRGFIGRLKTEKMITTDKSQGMNVITLCKYDVYNTPNTDDDAPCNSSIDLVYKELAELKTQLATQLLTHEQRSSNTNSKKEKKEEERNTSSPYNPPKGYEKFDFDFLDDALSKHFFEWLNYKTAKGQRYNSQNAIELCYRRLLEKAKGNFETSVTIIRQSIAGNRDGLFELKQKQDANTHQSKNDYRQQSDYTIGM